MWRNVLAINFLRRVIIALFILLQWVNIHRYSPLCVYPQGGFGWFGFFQKLVEASWLQLGTLDLDQMKEEVEFYNLALGLRNRLKAMGGIQFWKKLPAIGPNTGNVDIRRKSLWQLCRHSVGLVLSLPWNHFQVHVFHTTSLLINQPAVVTQ